MNYKKVKFFIPIFLSTITVLAQVKTSWHVGPFEHKVFIENAGQFDACLPAMAGLPDRQGMKAVLITGEEIIKEGNISLIK